MKPQYFCVGHLCGEHKYYTGKYEYSLLLHLAIYIFPVHLCIWRYVCVKFELLCINIAMPLVLPDVWDEK